MVQSQVKLAVTHIRKGADANRTVLAAKYNCMQVHISFIEKKSYLIENEILTHSYSKIIRI